MTARRLADGSKIIEINGKDMIYSVFFAKDGKQVVSGGVEGMIRRWRVDDGLEVGEPIPVEGAKIYAAVLSPDRKWLACGLRGSDWKDGRADIRVWDVQTDGKVRDIHGHTNTVFSVDMSPDSTKLATGATDKVVFIWSLTTRKKLVGPLKHDGWVVAVRFSPNGDRIATAAAENPDAKSIRIYNSHNGQRLLNIPFRVSGNLGSLLTWSADGRQLFAVSYGVAKCFDTSTGVTLSKWSIPDGSPASIALARNQNFIVISGKDGLSFWDASTHMQLGPVIKYTSTIWGIALSPDDDCIATGEANGKITLRNLRDILPFSYFTVSVSN